MQLESLWAAWIGGALAALALWALMARGGRLWLRHPVAAMAWAALGAVASEAWALRFPGPGTVGQALGWAAAIVTVWLAGIALDGWRTSVVWAWAVRPAYLPRDWSHLRGPQWVALTAMLPPLLTVALLVWRDAPLESRIIWPLLVFLLSANLARVGLIIGIQQRASGRALTPQRMDAVLAGRDFLGAPLTQGSGPQSSGTGR